MNISEEAIFALKHHLSPDQLKNKFIRFYAVQGCCGASVQIKITDEKTETDETFVQDEVRFSIDYRVKELLQNATFVHTGKGFGLEGISTGCC